MKEKIFQKNLKIITYVGKEIELLNDEELEKIAKAYSETFNESWGEDWTVEKALNEVVRPSFTFSEGRYPLASIVYNKDGEVAGFAWGVIVVPESIIAEKDMPYNLSREEKDQGAAVSRYWLEKVIKKDKVLMYTEFGAVKEYRKRIASNLVVDILGEALNLNCPAMILWSSLQSRVFELSLSIEWFPIHFFITNDLVLIAGSIKNSYEITKEASESEGQALDECYMKAFHNINRYMCN